MIINLFDGPDNKTKVGGGWSFLRNFRKGLIKFGYKISNKNYDVSMACAPTMVPRALWVAAAEKPRILRTDGIPEDFRNRGTGWSRLRQYAKQADVVIYQSNFIKNTIGQLLGRKGKVICNGVDTTIFRKDGDAVPKFGNPSIVFVHFRHDPNKRFQEAIERFRYFKLKNKNATISFIGDYPKSQVFWSGKRWDFGMLDLKQGKDWRFLSIIRDRTQLAKTLRSFDYIAYPSFADPCPNTLIEALACGLKPLWINSYGSSEEIIGLFKDKYDFSLKSMTKRYVGCFNESIKKSSK